MSRTLQDIASGVIVSATPATTATEAAQLMRQHHVGALVVMDVERGLPLGLLTDRDLVLAVMAPQLDPDVMTAGDLMSTELVSLAGSANLLDAIAAMRRQRLRRLLIRDETGRVIGLVSLEDVIEGLASEFTQLALALREARDRERQQRR